MTSLLEETTGKTIFSPAQTEPTGGFIELVFFIYSRGVYKKVDLYSLGAFDIKLSSY